MINFRKATKKDIAFIVKMIADDALGKQREDLRGKGIGKLMFEWVIERAKQKKAHVLQLTTDKKRSDAIQFYKKLGFKASHEGMKLHF